MIRASELGGRAVVDLDAAEKLGRISKVILNPDARRVAGFIVARRGSLFGQPAHVRIPASAVHAVGPDAVTVHHDAVDHPDADMGSLPLASDVVGRKVVSTDGQFLGVIHDVLISDRDGRIVGYELDDNDLTDRFGHFFGASRDRRPAVLRADAPLRTGRDLVVVPADAVTRGMHHGDLREDAPPIALDGPDGPTAAPPEASVARGMAGFPYATTWFQRGDDDGSA